MAKRAGIRATVKIVETSSEIDKRIRNAITATLMKAARRRRSNIEAKIRQIVQEALMHSPTYLSVSGGRLKSELGIPDGATKIGQIINEWVGSIDVQISPLKSRPKIILRVRGIDSSYKDVLGLSASTNVTEKGQPLEWLRWLLEEGNNPIILEYEIAPGTGRAGQQVMVRNARKFWKIPAEFAGTHDDNFVIRALDSVGKKIKITIAK